MYRTVSSKCDPSIGRYATASRQRERETVFPLWSQSGVLGSY